MHALRHSVSRQTVRFLAVVFSFAFALGLVTPTPGLAAPTSEADQPVALEDNVGNEKWAVLLCRFADSPTQRPFRVPAYNAAFNTDPNSHANYFDESSYGQLQISADVYKWRRIGPRDKYVGDFISAGGYDFLNKIFRACTRKHDAHVDFTQYDGIAIFLDDRELDVNDGTACQFGDTCTTDRGIGVSGAAWSDHRIKLLDGVRGFRVIWMANFSAALNEVTAHELSHTYGAPHSAAGADDATNDECFPSGPPACGHQWDLMASSWLSLPPDTHTLAATKVFHHGWISGSRRCNITTDGVQTIELERLAMARDNGRCVAITITQPGFPDAWYVVEARFPVGFDSSVPGAGVLISRICTDDDNFFCTQEPMVVGRDISPADGAIDEDSAEWQAGETFTNYNGQIVIEVLSEGDGFFNVRVTRDTTP